MPSDRRFPLQPCTVLVPEMLYPIVGRPTDDQIDAMVLLSDGDPVFLQVELEEFLPVEMLVKIEPVRDGKRRFKGVIANGSKFASAKGVFTEAPKGTLELVN